MLAVINRGRPSKHEPLETLLPRRENEGRPSGRSRV